MRKHLWALVTLALSVLTPAAAEAACSSAANTTGTDSAAVVANTYQMCNTGITAINSALPAGANIIGKVGIDQTTPGTTDSVSVKTSGYSAATSLTRTNDTNAYTAGDIVGAATGSTAALTFAIAPSVGGELVITSVSLEIDASAVISGETSYRLYLYNVTPPSALGDNAAWDIPSGDRASFLGYVDLGTPVDLGSTLYVQTDGLNKVIKAASGNVFGYLVTNGAYTPTAQRVYVITLHAAAL